MRRFLAAAAVAVFACLCGAARAHDKWELGTGGDDDDSSTPNSPVHGRAQTHDLEGSGSPPDEDWYRFPTRARQSYEARIFSASVYVQMASGIPICQAGLCASFQRVSEGGAALQTASATDGESHLPVLRWVAAANDQEYLRVRGGAGNPWTANDEYTIELSNTTLFAPRFNNSATQVTVLVLQNTGAGPVAGTIDFWNAAGTLLLGHPFTIAGHGVLTLNTAGLAGAAGQSGALSIAHDGGYAVLTGKAVALEPATGFTFDTAVVPVPR
jgi:hypothetical protein